jgi:hypothetical protein
VELATFNRQRAHLVAAAWTSQGVVLSPKSVASVERVLYFGGSGVRGAQIVMGARIEQLLSCGGETLFSLLSSAREVPCVRARVCVCVCVCVFWSLSLCRMCA